MKRTTTQLLTILFICIATSNFSQVISGSVKDKASGDALIGATVVVKGTGVGAAADIDGNFKFDAKASPPFAVTVSFLGYQSQELTINDVTVKLSVKLEAVGVEIKGAEVIDNRIGEKGRENPLTVEALDLVAIKETPSANFYDGLGQLKGVDVNSASIGFKVINTRGFNSTSPVRSLQIIDGVDNQAPGLNFSLGNFLGASELDVLKVDLVQGAAGAYYGPNAFNGVISMTTKSPFSFPGLSVMVRGAERLLFEGSVRYAQVFKNKAGDDKFAYKLNFYYLRADDWRATNYDATPQSVVNRNNPGGYDAVNRYGDEIASETSPGQSVNFPGLGTFYRKGYNESDVVNYNTRNIKANVSFHYKLKPDVELSYTSSFGAGTTVYQGENRYSLKDILYFQNKLEVKKDDKWFVRAYATNEDAGNSYDAVLTAFRLQNLSKSDASYFNSYSNYWFSQIKPKAEALPGYPAFTFPVPPNYVNQIDSVVAAYPDSLAKWHGLAANFASQPANFSNEKPFFEPGTARFDSAFAVITSTPVNLGGSRLVDKSALYHLHGQYKFTPKFMDITVGGNGRLYTPNSGGTIFSDTAGRRITNYEFGVYAGFEKKVIKEKLKINLTARLDKNQNFNFLVSPAASLVYSPDDNNTFRLSFSSAIRNPTLADQYLYYNVGRAILIGNISGYDSLVTVESVRSYLTGSGSGLPDASLLVYQKIDPIRPEKARTFEVGYRGTLFNHLYVDAGYYYTIYKDFIGFKLGADIKVGPTGFPDYLQVYRVSANTKDLVNTQGVNIGLTYYFLEKYSVNGNYSWNKLDRRGSSDPIIPAFNTPQHKFNIGVSGRDLKIGRLEHCGFNINYKWIQGFTFEGAPQFTGAIPTYDMLDAQINHKVTKINTVFKLGAQNMLNNKRSQVFGGPAIGRLIYFSLVYEMPSKRS